MDINGDGKTEQTIQATQLGTIDGAGDHIVHGQGQDLTILSKRDGDGTTTLTNFNNVRILGKKDGNGVLVIEDCSSIDIQEVNGPGNTYLSIPGPKHIHVKDGDGNIYYKGSIPVVDVKNGAGNIIPA